MIRLLLRHPQVDIACFTSRQYAGKSVADVFPRFRGQIDAVFVEPSLDNDLGGDVALSRVAAWRRGGLCAEPVAERA